MYNTKKIIKREKIGNSREWKKEELCIKGLSDNLRIDSHPPRETEG
jgi:hypothetical protein